MAFVISQTGQQPPEHDLQMTALFSHGGVGQLVQQPAHKAVALGHPVDRRKEVNPAPLPFKSFLLQPCVIGHIFNELGRLPDNLAGQ
jgi:hypothetical protein